MFTSKLIFSVCTPLLRAGAVVVLTSDFNIDGGVDDMSAFAENYRTILNDFLAENMIKVSAWKTWTRSVCRKMFPFRCMSPFVCTFFRNLNIDM